MKKIVKCFLFLIVQCHLFSQTTTYRLYANDKNEFICFERGSYKLRVSNKDGFDTYLLGEGTYDIDKEGRYCKLKCSSMITRTSTMSKSTRSDNNIFIKIIDTKGSPMSYVYVKITNTHDKNMNLVSWTNKYGELTLNDYKSYKLVNKEVVISVKTIGFITEKSTKLESGNTYIIKSCISDTYPFSLIGKNDKVTILQQSDQHVEIKIGAKLKVDLPKSNENNFNCTIWR